ncbi:hypothetical protein B0H14DRAFT_2978221 [Mycena olivaceomarginata]|nr:hypothetical protein B0H14DRAFT_2978221 [Mycena olivaceomarginata]
MSSTNIVNWNGMVLTQEGHTQMEAYHKSFGTSRKQIREVRGQTKGLCALCFGDGPLHRCARCKVVSYCSKECQTKDWQLHKTACSRTEESTLRVNKILQIFSASKFLEMQLQTCAVLACDLLDNPQPRKPFILRVDIAVEPVESDDLLDVFDGRPVRTPLPGMVQVNGFMSLPDELLLGGMEVWKPIREGLDEIGEHNVCVGVLQMSKGNNLLNMAPLIVDPIIPNLVRTRPQFESHNALTGKVEMRPQKLDTVIEFMNNHIRADKANRLGLRTNMTEPDLQVIRDAAAGRRPSEEDPFGSGYAAWILRRKLATVPEYQKYFIQIPKT